MQPGNRHQSAGQGSPLDRWDWAWLCALLAWVGLLHCLKVGNGDIWEHLKIGEMIVRHRGIPESRDILWTWPGHPWLAHAWLFEVIVYALYRLGGLGALYVLDIGLSWSAFALLYWACRREGCSRLAAVWLTALGVVAVAGRFSMRPEATSGLGLAMLLALLCSYRAARTRSLWVLIPLGLVWVNLHGGMLTGVVVLGTFTVGSVADYLLARRRGLPAAGALEPARVKHLVVATVAFAATSFATPNGARLHAWSFGGGLGGLTTQVTEYMPLWVGYRQNWIPILALAALVLWVAWLLMRQGTRAPLAGWLPLVVLAGWAVKMMRQVWPASLVALGVAAFAGGTPPPGKAASRLPGWAPPLAWCALSALTALGMWNRWTAFAWHGVQVGLGQNVEMLPVGATDWLLRERPPGRLFNTYGDGYYLAFRLYPTYRLFIDGFTDYPPALSRIAEAVTSSRNPTPALDEAGVGIVILGPEANVYWEFARRLEAEGQWVAVYGDGVSSLYLRSKPPYAPLIEKWGYKALMLAHARPRAGAAPAEIAREMERLRREGVESSGLHTLLGLLAERSADLERAEGEYRMAAARSHSAIAPLRLAALARGRGDWAEAQRWQKRARGAIPAPLMREFLSEAAGLR